MSSHVTASYRRRLRSRNSAILAAQLHSCKLLQGIQLPGISLGDCDSNNDAHLHGEKPDAYRSQREYTPVGADPQDFSLLHTAGKQTCPMPPGTWIQADYNDEDAHSLNEGKPDSQRFQQGFSPVIPSSRETIHLHPVSTRTVTSPPGTWIHDCHTKMDAHTPAEGKLDSQRIQVGPMSPVANSMDPCHLHTVSTQTCSPPPGTWLHAGDTDVEAHSLSEGKPDQQRCCKGPLSVFACTLGINIMYTIIMESETRQEWQRVLEVFELFQLSGLQPRSEAISAASNACYHLGYWKQALDLFDANVYLCSNLPHQFGALPRQEIFDNAISACWNLRLWAKASQIREYMRRLEMQTTTNSLNAAISACHDQWNTPTLTEPHIDPMLPKPAETMCGMCISESADLRSGLCSVCSRTMQASRLRQLVRNQRLTNIQSLRVLTLKRYSFKCSISTDDVG